MDNLVIMHDSQAVTTSLQVAETFGKLHKDVIRAIESKIHSAQNCAQYDSMFVVGEYKDASGKTNKMYYMNRDGFTFIAFGFTGKRADDFKLSYIQAFNQMEAAIQLQIPQTPEDMLRLTMQVSTRTVERVDKLDERVSTIEQHTLLTPGEYNFIARSVNRTVAGWIHDHNLILTPKQRSLFYRDLNRGLAEYLGIRTRTQIRHKDFDKACDFILNWIPSTAVSMEARSLQTELIKRNREED